MKKQLFTLLFVFTTFLVNQADAQYVLAEADAQYTLFNYSKAIDLYEQAYKKKPSLHAVERLAACYKLKNDYAQTESWYAIAVGMPNSKPENTLAYARALQSNSKYVEAKAKYQQYINLDPNVSAAQANIWLASCDSALKWTRAPKLITIENLKKLNSAQSDWGAVKQQDNVVFASDRGLADRNSKTSGGKPFLKFDGRKMPDKKTYNWTGNHYLQLYLKDAKDSIKLFPFDAGTDYHVGSASFTQDGREVYFTMTKISDDTEFDKVKQVKGKLGTINVEIYSSKMDENGKWSAPIPFKYNNVNDYSVGDPYITADGKLLYFASNMPGGSGGADLYVSRRGTDAEWGQPVNLKEVNTAGNDRSPSFDIKNNFYFSSDGRVGMGGLDVFKATVTAGQIAEPQNLGYPINSPQDDFALNFIDKLSGYFASNRLGGLGEDDIYSFSLQEILAFKLTGIAYNKNTNLPLSNTLVSLKKPDGTPLKVQTDDTGKFNFNLEKDSDYELTGEKSGFRSDMASVTTKNLTDSKEIVQNLYLQQIELNKEIRLENIYYDFDKSAIRPDAAKELDKLVKIMKDNPTIWIALGSHTDSRGNDQYNQWLSQSRANSAVQYIIDHGIDKNRIEAKGYGETRLLNKCVNGAKCSAAEHQLNRRTEFSILKY